MLVWSYMFLLSLQAGVTGFLIMDILPDELKNTPVITGYYGSGIYLVCSLNLITGDEYLHYIGSSKNIYKRWQNTSHPFRVVYDAAEYPFIAYLRIIKSDNPKPIEKEMIKKYQPKMNKQWR